MSADCGSYIVGTDLRNTVTAWWGSTTPTGPLIDVSDLLQQMAAESTGTAAPIHLQGETMAIASTPDPAAVPGHSITFHHTSDPETGDDYWMSCECGWSGPHHRAGLGMDYLREQLHREAEAHTAQFKAPKQATGLRDTWRYNVTMMDGDELQHLDAYRAKRAEWLQAHRPVGVAQRAVDVARGKVIQLRRDAREAERLADAAVAHRDEVMAVRDNLQAELLALVKGEQ